MFDANQKTLELPAHWFTQKDEVHEILDEWYLGWIQSNAAEGTEKHEMAKRFILYSFLQACIRHSKLV